jgi:8-oxo-dGTP pyrophosphatase MutT (NUDIX family)
MMPEVFSCGFLIFRRQPQLEFLLMRHAERWDLPKGHVDPGETHLACALRELQEETGILPSDIQIDPDFQFIHDYLVTYKTTPEVTRTKRLIVFLGTLINAVDVQATEHLGYQWFPWKPPHAIQTQTIDPLLESLDLYFQSRPVSN